MTFTIRFGLPTDQRQRAAELYWQAFGGKLGAVLGPDRLALRLLDRVIREDHAFVALDPAGRLVGLVGFKTPEGAFAGGEFRDLRAIYGLAGAAWRSAILWLLEREIDNERFLMDGLCVAREVRGQGVGTALLETICHEALARGYGAVRLDVIDTNWRARKLYERCGFVATTTAAVGPLRHVFGFNAATTMVREVG